MIATTEVHTEERVDPPGVLLEADEIVPKPWRYFAHAEGMALKPLWQERGAGSYAGLLSLEPGTGLGPHRHHRAVHHRWVLEGSCRIGGKVLDAGSYALLPADTVHSLEEAGPDGCTLFYLYMRLPD